MTKTRWTGGFLGNELLETGITSLFFNEFYNVIPDAPVHTGLNITQYTVPFGFKNNTLRVTVNGKDVESNPVTASSGTFTINDTSVGYIRCSYVPYNNTLAYTEQYQNQYSYPIRKRFVKTNKAHIKEILNALNNICKTIQIPIRKYSISSYTSEPQFFVSELNSNIPITKQLFVEIMEHVQYLNNYVVDNKNISAPITYLATGDLPTYEYNTISAFAIERYRLEINNIEGGI